MADNAARWKVAPYFVVEDVVATAHFYRDKLGFDYERLWGEPPCFTIMRHCGAMIMLRQIVGSPGLMSPNRKPPDPEDFVWDAYLWIDGVDALHDKFKGNGVVIVRPLCDQEYGMREFDILDCNGFRLCFAEDISQ